MCAHVNLGMDFWRRLRLALPFLIYFVAIPAFADPAAQARFHDELARGHYAKGRYEEALREFFLEQRVSPNPRISFNIALCFQELKRSEEAFLYYSEYLASDDADVERRAYAERRVQALSPQLALVLVQSEPPGANIYVDKKELGSYGQTPRVIAVPAGEHQIYVELEGYRAATSSVEARRGEQAGISLSPERILGQLRVESSVGGSVGVRSASGDAVASGDAPFSTDLPPGTYEVSVRAPGHLPWSGLAVVEADAQGEIAAVPTRLPAPSGAITVTSNVPGALVELDGQPAGFTPTILSGIGVGEHLLAVQTPKLVPWQGNLKVSAEQRSWVTVTLDEPPRVQRSPATWVMGGLTVASLAAAGVFGILAWQTHEEFLAAQDANSADAGAIKDRGITLNTAADVSWVVGGVAAVTTVLLYFLTAEKRGGKSSASVAQGEK